MEKHAGKIIKTFTSRMQARLLLVFCVIALLLVGIMGRLIYIIQVDGDRYTKQVLSREANISAVLPYKRGDILDRNGTILARSELQYRLILDPRLLLDNEDYIAPTMAALKDNFNIDNATIQTILQDKPNSQYYVVLKNLKYEEVDNFKKLMEEEDTITGVWFEEEYVRAYPYNALACDILGFTSADNKGYFGIEEYYNDELNGSNGREYGYFDADLNIERIVNKAVNGNSIVSTVDADVQRILQEQIIKFNAEIGSKNIGILVMNPNNGDIIAMASNKEYDLNEPRNMEGIYTEEELAAMTEEQKTEALNTLWKNDVISSSFEPGSTFKPFTISAALEENVVSEDSTYLCDGGEQVGDSYIHCSKRTGHGDVTLGQSLMLSCNDALMQIASQEGKDNFFHYQNSFGFGGKTGIDLPGEETGLIIPLSGLNSTELATSSFGQSLTVTMVQMAAAFSSLVNGGYYYQPHVLKEIVSDSGATIKQFDKLLVRQTVSEQTSEFIQKTMYQTVEAGTAQGAKVTGYSIGGKTGTAQKLPREAKTYVVSFLGCVPAINPEIVIYVMVDEPQNVEKQADSSIATKFASRIMNEILPVLGIYPEGEIDYLLPEENAGTGTTDVNIPAGTTGQTGGTQTDNQPVQENTGSQNSETTDNNGGASGTQESQEGTSDNQDGTSPSDGTAEDAGTTGADGSDEGTTSTDGITEDGAADLNGTSEEGAAGTADEGSAGAENDTQDNPDEFNADVLD